MIKISDKTKKEALKLFKDYDELWVNTKGEFFTNENLALLSVEKDKKKIMKLDEKYCKVKEPKNEDMTEEMAKEMLLAASDLNSLDYHKELKPMFDILKLEAGDNKTASLIKALEEYKETLKAE